MKKIITTCTLALSLLGTIGANEAYAATTNCPKQTTTIQYATNGSPDIQTSINSLLKKNCNIDIKCENSNVKCVSDTSNKECASKTVAKKSNQCVKVKGVKSNCNKANTAKKCAATTTKSNKATTSTASKEKVKSSTTKNSTKASTANMSSYAKQVLDLVNKERANAGLSALTTTQELTNAANTRAVEIKQTFSHTRPNGTSFSTALKEAGVSYQAAGENIAYGQKTPQEVVTGWMNSPGHRANILNSNYNKIGIGVYKASNGTIYWTQNFTN